MKIKLIRAERQAGEFTTVPTRILNDKRLEAVDVLMLIQVFSHKDGFNLSRTALENAVRVKRKGFDACIERLERLGYVSRVADWKNNYYYTFSEFGNLKLDTDNPSENHVNFPIEGECGSKLIGRDMSEDDAIFVFSYLRKIGSESHFEEVLNRLHKDLISGKTTIVDEVSLKQYLPCLQQKGRSKSFPTVASLRKQYKVPQLYDEILPLVIANAGGDRITKMAEERIIFKTMDRFKDNDGSLTEGILLQRLRMIKGDNKTPATENQFYQN